MAEYKFEDIAINSTQKKKPVEEDKYHYLGLEHLDPGTFTISRFGSEVAPIGEKLLMKKGDVLFGKRRAYQKKVAIAPFDGIFSAHGMVLRPKENVIDKDFFPLFIASDYFLDAAINISVGSLSPTINWRDLKELKFTLPTLAEQKKLAEVLWAIVATMESYKKLLVKTDKLVKAKFVEMFGDPVTNSKKLPTMKIKEVAPVRSFEQEIEKTDGKVWLLNLDMIESNTGKLINKLLVSESEIGSSVCKFSTGNVLYSKLRPYLNKVMIPDSTGYASTELLPLKPKEKFIRKKFLEILLRHDSFVSFINSKTAGTKMPRVSMDVFRNFNVIIPTLESQDIFADFVQKSEESKSATQASLDSLTKLYKKIIVENLGGKN